MKQRVLSALLACAVLFSLVPISLSASAEDTAAGSGIKLGIEKGDIVYFAGKDEPMAWRVLDAEKTNTEDESGIWLLSDEIAYRAFHNLLDINGLVTYGQAFFEEYFTEPYKSAAMAVSQEKKDEIVDGFVYQNVLNNDTVFALSIGEAQKLSDEERKFNGSDSWWLRSASINELYPGMNRYGRVDSQTGEIAYWSSNSSNAIKLRPSVNLQKSAINVKISDSESAALLLPNGDKSAADGKFASFVGTGSWSLCMKDESTTVTRAYTTVQPLHELSAFVATSVENVGDNDYISFIIRKPDGTVSCYARVKQTASEATYTLTLPDDTDLANDSLYVFHETVNGDFPSLVTDLTKLCLTHEGLKTESISDAYHRVSCSICDYKENFAHTRKTESISDDRHRTYCTLCDYEETLDHRKAYESLSDDEHRITCMVCGYDKSFAHTLQYNAISGDEHRATCTECGYMKDSAHAFDFDCKKTDENGRYMQTCTICGSDSGVRAVKGAVSETVAVARTLPDGTAADCTVGKNYTVNAANELFKKDNDTAIFTTADTSDGRYVEVKLDTVRPISLYGIRFQNSASLFVYSDSYFDTPKKIVIGGIGENGTETIAELQLGGFIEREPSAQYTFLMTENTKTYSQYVIRLYGNKENIICGSITLLGNAQQAAQPTFKLSGVMAENLSDLLMTDEDYICTLNSRSGHPAAENVAVYCGDELFDGAVYDEQSGKLTIPAANRPSGSVIIQASSDDSEVSVKVVSDGVLQYQGETAANFGKTYVGGFADRYEMTWFAPRKEIDCTVTIGGVRFTDYTLEYGTLIIPGQYITGDIVITAHEAGTIRGENAAVSVQAFDGDILHYFDNLSEALDLYGLGKTGIWENENAKITFLRDINEQVTVTDSTVTLDLNGFGWTRTDIDGKAAILTVPKEASVRIVNGKIGLHNVPCYIDVSGTVELGEGVYTNSYLTGEVYWDAYLVTVRDGGKLIMNGADLNSAAINRNNGASHFYASVLVQNGGQLELNGGIICGLVLEPSAKVLYKVGTIESFVTRTDAQNTDFFAGLAESSVLADTDKANMGAYIDGSYTGEMNFVEKTDLIEKQPKNLTLYTAEREFGTTGMLSIVAAGNDKQYQWYKNGEPIENSDTALLQIGTSDTEKTDTYYCYVYSDGYLTRSEPATVWYRCSHKVYDRDNNCLDCGKKVLASLAEGDDTEVNFTDFSELLEFESTYSSAVITLLCDVEWKQTMQFRGQNTLLNLNRHTLSGYNIEVCGNLTVKNGTVTAEISSLRALGGLLTIEDGTYSSLWLDPGCALLKGGTFGKILDYSYEHESHLPKGYGYRTQDGVYLDLAGNTEPRVKNVTVAPLPYAFVSAPQSALVEVGAQHTLEVIVEKAAFAANRELTYQWSEAIFGGQREGYTLTPIEGATESTVTLPTDIPSGTQKTYAVTVSCMGCERTVYAAVSFGVGTPSIDKATLSHSADGRMPYFRFSTAGNDCIAVFVEYEDGVPSNIQYVSLYATDHNREFTYEDLGYYSEPEVKIMIIGSLSDMKPLTESVWAKTLQ